MEIVTSLCASATSSCSQSPSSRPQFCSVNSFFRVSRVVAATVTSFRRARQCGEARVVGKSPRTVSSHVMLGIMRQLCFPSDPRIKHTRSWQKQKHGTPTKALTTHSRDTNATPTINVEAERSDVLSRFTIGPGKQDTPVRTAADKRTFFDQEDGHPHLDTRIL